MSFRWLLFSLLVAWALPLQAQSTDAYDQGVAALEAGNVDGALVHFRRAARENPTLDTMLALGATLQEAGHFADAIAEYQALLRGDWGPLPIEDRAFIEEAMVVAQSHLATLHVHSNVAQTAIECDGDPIGAASPGAPITIAIEAGPHRIQANAEGHAPTTQAVQLRQNQHQELHLNLTPLPAPVVAEAVSLSPEPTQAARPGPWILLGASAVPILAGTITGLQVNARISDSRHANSHRESQAHIDDAHQLRGWSYASFAIAGAMVIAGTVWLLLDRRRNPPPPLALRF